MTGVVDSCISYAATVTVCCIIVDVMVTGFVNHIPVYPILLH